MKTSELTGVALDYAVAKAMGATDFQYDTVATCWVTLDGKDRALSKGWAQAFTPSTDWAHGGPLLSQHKVSRTIDHSGLWVAYAGYNINDEKRHMQCDALELVAGLRCLVASKLGDEVNIPENLQ